MRKGEAENFQPKFMFQIYTVLEFLRETNDQVVKLLWNFLAGSDQIPGLWRSDFFSLQDSFLFAELEHKFRYYNFDFRDQARL